MNCYLGVDIGTTAVKTVAFAPNGEVIAKAEQAFPMHHPQPDRSEQDPDEIFRAVCTTVRKVVNHCQDYSVLFISFSAAMHSLIALNKDGKRLTECIIWADNRAADIASKLKASQSFPAIYQRTGVPVHAMSPLCKSMWLREHEPDIFGATDKLLGIKEFVIHRLTGQFLIDAGVASATGFLNTNTLQWDQLALDLAGVQARQLPKVVPVSFQCTLTAEGAGQLGVPVATKLVMGGSDGAMANIGTPMSMNDGLVITIGTSTAARVLTSRPGTDEAMRTFCYHAREGLYLVGGGGNSGGIVLQWLRESVLQSTVPMEEMLSLAEGAPPCADGLCFFTLPARRALTNLERTGPCCFLWAGNSSPTIAHGTRGDGRGDLRTVYYWKSIDGNSSREGCLCYWRFCAQQTVASDRSGCISAARGGSGCGRNLCPGGRQYRFECVRSAEPASERA